MYLIDTNIFLELFLDRERREECEKFLSRIESGELIGVITSFSLHSIAIILEKLKGLYAYKKFLEVIFNLTFDDALHYYVAKRFNLTLVSFDKDFDRTDMKRKEPREII